MSSPTAALKWFAHFDSGSTRIDEEGEYPCLGANGTIGTAARPNVSQPAVLVGRVGSAGQVHLLMDPAYVTDNCIIVIPDSRTDVKFLYYSILAADLQRLVGKTAQPLLVASDLKQVPFRPLPRDEQKAVVKFLDRETTRIDSLIAKKELLLTLLEEKLQTATASAVTKGLDSGKPMRECDLPGLGSLPEHWRVMPVKYLFQFLDGRRIPLSSEERAEMDRSFPYFGASGVIDQVESYLFDEPLVLLGEDGANLLQRSTPLAFVARGKYWVNNHAHVLRPRDGRVDFWASVLNAVDFTPLVSGSAQPKLTQEALSGLKVPVPPEDERDRIERWVNHLQTTIRAVSERVLASVSLLRERRNSLICAAVAAQIDPREMSTDSITV